MRAPRDNERGDTLIEILLAIVLIGLMMGAVFGSITLSSTGSNKQKKLATADGILRDYAEAAKTAVRDPINGCGKANPTTFTVTAPSAPPGFTVTPPSISQSCPPTTNANPTLDVQIVQLFVRMLNISAPKELDVALRTP